MKSFSLFRLPIIVRVIIAIGLGAGLGMFMPAWFVRIFVSFNTFFGQFIGFLVPLIILALVTASIANAEQNAGRMLRITMIALLLSTLFAGLTSFGVGELALPHLIRHSAHANQPAAVLLSEEALGGTFSPFFTLTLPPPLDVLSALTLALILGLGMRTIRADALKRGVTELQALVMLSIEKAIVPLLPLYIFGVFLKMSASGGMLHLVHSFFWLIVLVLAMLVAWALVLYLVAAVIARRNPFRMIWDMMPACIVAFATCSSAATIPVTLRSAQKLVSKSSTSEFVIPLCANLHIPSVTVFFTICALAVMRMVGQPLELESFLIYIVMLTFTCVAVPGIPGGVVAVLPVMATVLGFTPEMQAVCLSLGVLLDAPLTAANVLCDGAICAIVDKTT